MAFIIGLIIPALSYIFQIYPRFYNKYFGVDVWSRMIEADYFRKNHHKPPLKKISDGFILDGYLDYPPALPWMLSFIPKDKLLKIQGFIAPLFDIIQNYLVFLITLQLTNNLYAALLSQIIYATIPLTVLENSYLTPRSLGYLNFTLAFYPLLLYSLVPKPPYLIFGLFFLILLFFTHKFALQSFLFISIFLSIITRDPFYILIFLAGMAIAIVISKGYYLRILNGHISNILFWVKNYKYRFSHQVRGLTFPSKKDLVGKIYSAMTAFPPLALIGTNLWIIIPLFLFVVTKFHLPVTIPSGRYSLTDPLMLMVYVWIFFFYIFSIAVLSIKQLTPIGEGQRYMEMSLAPISIISAITFFVFLNSPYKNIVIVLYSVILFTNLFLAIFLQIKGIIEDKNRSMTKDMTDIFKYINKMHPKPQILCIPHQITTMIVYNTKAKVLVEIQAGDLRRVDDVFPVIKKPISEIAKIYNLNLLVIKKDYVEAKELNLDMKSLLFETETIQIFKI